MRLDNFDKFRRCDYYDEVECAKKFLQDYLFNTNRMTDKKCLPPCKGVQFEADKVTVSTNFSSYLTVIKTAKLVLSVEFFTFNLSTEMQTKELNSLSKSGTIFKMI